MKTEFVVKICDIHRWSCINGNECIFCFNNMCRKVYTSCTRCKYCWYWELPNKNISYCSNCMQCTKCERVNRLCGFCSFCCTWYNYKAFLKQLAYKPDMLLRIILDLHNLHFQEIDKSILYIILEYI